MKGDSQRTRDLDKRDWMLQDQERDFLIEQIRIKQIENSRRNYLKEVRERERENYAREIESQKLRNENLRLRLRLKELENNK